MSACAKDGATQCSCALGLEFRLPEGWYCVDPQEPASAAVLARLLPPGLTAPPVMAALCGVRAPLALVHPGMPAITGAVLLAPPLSVTAAQAWRTLHESGEAVGFGNLDGLPVISLIRHSRADVELVQTTYLICGRTATATLTFAGPALPDAKSVVGEVAHVVSRARVVRSTSGCPV